MSERIPGEGPVLRGAGAAWPPAPEEAGEAPRWTNGRAFTAVWRDSLSFGMGSLLAASDGAISKQFPNLKLSGSWNHRPPPGTDADVEQAIGAKIHVSHRMLPLLADSQLVVIEPERVASIPRWASDEEEAAYAAEAQLTASPLFLDCEGVDGSPVIWEQETWPLPFFLRGALCWKQDDLLSIIPFGSVGSRHPWGGTDYQAWSRWVYLQGHSAEWPDLGPGDFLARGSGEVRSWVDAESESICAHQGSVAHNLCRGVLSILMCLEALKIDLEPEPSSRQVRRRAERKNEKIGLVPKEWPIPMLERAERPPPPIEEDRPSAPEGACPSPKTHARLSQCHSMWHEALDGYADPDVFVGHLNALIQGLRSVTWVLQKELTKEQGFDGWYAEQQEMMRGDSRMKWLISARNEIEKQGDLDTSSVAQVRVVGSWLKSPAIELDVDPTAGAHEIARRVQVVGLPNRAAREGVLEVERRWTVDDLAGDEILDVLAHCYGVLTRIVAAAHDQFAPEDGICPLGQGGVCEHVSTKPHPSGRAPCMVAGRKARTVRRDLESGVLVEVGIQPLQGPTLTAEELFERYGPKSLFEEMPEEEGVIGVAELFHRWGRHFFLADDALVTVVWMFKEGAPLRQIALEPEDQREKYLSIKNVAEQIDELGVDEIIFTTEMWEAPAVGLDDQRAFLHPEEREDRSEALGTYVLNREGVCRLWHSRIEREGEELRLGDVTAQECTPPHFLRPILDVWEGWGEG